MAQQAKVPRGLHCTYVGDLQPGEHGWVVPSALFVDASGYTWLDIWQEVKDFPEGDATMLVRCRLSDGSYAVEYAGEYRWARTGSFYGADDLAVPVAEFVHKKAPTEVPVKG